MTKMKRRPPRLYSDTKGRYIKLNGKKVYIKSQFNNRNLVKVIINNFTKRLNKKRKKNIKRDIMDLEELNKSSNSNYKPGTDLAKILFYQTLNKKDEEERKAIKQEPLAQDQRKLLDIQHKQLEDYKDLYRQLPPPFEGPGGISYIQPHLSRLIGDSIIKVGDTLIKKENQVRSARELSEQHQKYAEEARQREQDARYREDEAQQYAKYLQRDKEEAENQSQIQRKISELEYQKSQLLQKKNEIMKNKDLLNSDRARDYELFLKERKKFNKNPTKMKELHKVLDDYINNPDLSSSNNLIDNPDSYNYKIIKLDDEIRVIDSNIREINDEIEKTKNPYDNSFIEELTPQGKENVRKIDEDQINLLKNLHASPIKIGNFPTNIEDEITPPKIIQHMRIPTNIEDEITPTLEEQASTLSDLAPTPSKLKKSLETESPFRSPSAVLQTSPTPVHGNVDIHSGVKYNLKQGAQNTTNPELQKLSNQNDEFHRSQTVVYVPSSRTIEHQPGSGNTDGGIYNDEIEKVMDNYKQNGFKGVYAIDEINKIPVSNKMGVILNLDKHNQPGSHWVGLYIDADGDQSVDYYDSYGEDPPESLMKDLKELVARINPDVYLKFKINKIKQQAENSDSCGIFAMQFLIDRFNGKPFIDCTGYSDVMNSERKARKFRKKLKEFGYL